MTSGAKPCPVCRGTSFGTLIDFGNVPRSGTFLDTRDQNFRTISLAFGYCKRCALVRQEITGQPVHDYVEIPRATARQLPDYSVALAKKLADFGLSPQELVVEVGANDGGFLDILAAEGYQNLLAVEPSAACAGICREKGYRVAENYLDPLLADRLTEEHGSAGAVICRHTLEHVPEPEEFVRAMRSLLRPGGMLLVEVPTSHTVIHNLLGHELWDEHIHLFGPANLAAFISNMGFSVLSQAIWPHRGTENLLVWAARGPQPEEFSMPENQQDVQACEAFQERWSEFSRKAREHIETLPSPVAAIGAAHPQSNFLLFTGLGEYVDMLVDDDPGKVGKFVPSPSPIPVVASDRLLHDFSPATILRTGFGCDAWMDRVISDCCPPNTNVVSPFGTAGSTLRSND
jgi:SAM-dependent methyltransferase